MTAGADVLLSVMRARLGMSGRPNVATQWYAAGHGSEYLDASWCDMFVSWAASRAACAAQVGEFALCQEHLNWFKRMGLAGTQPRKGAVVFFDWNNDNWADHVGVVEAVNRDGSITTIEGNTSDEVARRHRFPADVLGYGYPAYLSVGNPPYPGKLLMLGSKGPIVREVQKRLIKLGYPLARYGADGKYGVETVREVKAFQRVARSKNLKVEIDGRIGPVTWRELFA